MEILDKRRKDWFPTDNDFIDEYARHLDPIGVAVYNVLCRHSNNETQKCFPGMDLIAEKLGITRQTVSKYLRKLADFKIIHIESKIDTKNKKRENNVYTLLDKSVWSVEPCKPDEHGKAMLISSSKPCLFDHESHVNDVNSNNTNINNTNINNMGKNELPARSLDAKPLDTKAEKRARFVPPTVDEVSAYCTSRSNGIDPEHFCSYYEARGWKVGREKMVSWKAAVITWEKLNKERQKSNPVKKATPGKYDKFGS